MSIISALDQLDVENVQCFNYKCTRYERNNNIKDILNKMFSANIKHVFSSYRCLVENNSVNFGESTFICVNQEGEFTVVTSSERASIYLI